MKSSFEYTLSLDIDSKCILVMVHYRLGQNNYDNAFILKKYFSGRSEVENSNKVFAQKYYHEEIRSKLMQFPF